MGALQEASAKLNAARDELRRIAKEQGRVAVMELLTPVFEYPVDAVRWHQYTPYFNDGDPCVFSVGELTIKLQDPDEGDYEDGFTDAWSLTYRYAPFPESKYAKHKNITQHQMDEYRAEHERRRESALANLPQGFTVETMPIFAEVVQEVNETLQGAEDFLEAAFGDHVEITVTTDGIEVVEYDHD